MGPGSTLFSYMIVEYSGNLAGNELCDWYLIL
jgi:hypothetical protein